MKITINSILTFMKEKQNFNISEEQEQEINDHFYKEAEHLIYWSYYENNKVFSHLYEGIITKDFYDYVKTLDENKIFAFNTPVDNYDFVNYTIKDLKFNEDPEFIIAYLNSNRKTYKTLKASIMGSDEYL